MTARDRYRRCQAYARASKHARDQLLAVLAGCAGFWNYRPGRSPALDHARRHESHAWARLPDTARAAILTPSP